MTEIKEFLHFNSLYITCDPRLKARENVGHSYYIARYTSFVTRQFTNVSNMGIQHTSKSYDDYKYQLCYTTQYTIP